MDSLSLIHYFRGCHGNNQFDFEQKVTQLAIYVIIIQVDRLWSTQDSPAGSVM